MTTIGKISEISSLERDYQWKIENFTSILEKENLFYSSPEFTFADATWNLRIYPNGHENKQSVGYIDLYLCKTLPDQPISLEYYFHIKTTVKKPSWFRHFSHVFDKNSQVFGRVKIIKISELLLKKSEFLPNNIFTIVCTLKHIVSESANNFPTAKCSYCNRTLNTEDISFHEERCLEKPIKCPECCDVIKIRSLYEHVCQVAREKAIGEMLHYFKDIMVSGEHSDTIIQVKEVKFRLHRNILAARNLFFSALFKNEMKEKATGVVSVNDCEPDIFRQFVHFLYTGILENMSQENVCSLYEIADKYQDELLKEKCLNFMEDAISVETFCEFITLALKFGEKKLLKKATEFFISKNGKEIVRQVKWQDFLREYPTHANELFIKSLDHYIQ